MAQSSLRHKIISEALARVRAGGAEALTMRSLAQSLGYSPATLYLHVRSKSELLAEVALIGMRELIELLEPVLTGRGDPADQLARSSRVYLDFARENAPLYRLMFDPCLDDITDDQATARLELWALTRAAFERGVESGALRGQDPELVAALNWMALHGFAMLADRGRLPATEMAGRHDYGALRDALIADRLQALRG